jgi:hypothetical protein
MGPLARALLGVALGSCLTLFAHPVSRQFMLGLLPRSQAVAPLSAATGHVRGKMERPHSLIEAGLWMQLGCEKLRSSNPPNKHELLSLVALARNTGLWQAPGVNEKENAFWPEMAAVFLEKLGRREEAKKEWLKASTRSLWRDYQASRLLLTSQEMDRAGGKFAWHLAAAYYKRQSFVPQAIYRYAVTTTIPLGVASKEDLRFRMATLANGQSMAASAQSMDTLRFGVGVANLAIVPKGSSGDMKASEVAKARGHFYENLKKVGFADEANRASSTYNEIDSLPVLTGSFDPDSNAARFAIYSIFTSTFPCAMLLVSIFGGLVWGAGALVLRFAGDHVGFGWPRTIAFGSALGVGVFSVTFLPLVAIISLLSALFLVFTPKQERSRYPADLGPLFSWMMGVLALLFLTVLGLFFIQQSQPDRIIMPLITGANPDYLAGRNALMGLAAIIFAMVLLASPMWAFALRVRTPYMLGLCLRSFGRMLTAMALAGVLIGGPICVYADSRVRDTLEQLVGNEPVHYVIRFE